MTEEFLYYIWKNRLFYSDLTTIENQYITIIHPGVQNLDSGPDFFNARLRIGDTEWAGNVEIHIKSTDWIRHKHQQDGAYNSVVLHVVYEHDAQLDEIKDIPTLALKGHFDEALFFRYKNLISGRDWIPCGAQISKVDDLTLYSFFDSLLIERLERKTAVVFNYLQQSNNHWESAFYIALARGFGFNVNAEPFELLAKSLPIEILAKHKTDILQLEALLFGQAGLLNKNLKDEYSQTLVHEYSYLQKKYQLQAIAGYQWKFMKMRPVNFPTIRIAQFAQLVHKSVHLLSKILEVNKIEDLYSFFKLETSAYWTEHFTFGKKSKSSVKNFGKPAFDLILINTIVPFMFVYAEQHQTEFLKERAILWLNNLDAEKNGIVNRWIQSGVRIKNAAQSQASLTLKKEYCDKFKCLECRIGNSLLKKV